MAETVSPYVSIIMAVKNTEPYLPACLDSVLAQTYSNWELIAVNDHSTDRAPEILQAYSQIDERIRVYHGRGHRLIPTLQEAYRHVRGTLINRMDSDDLMPPYKLEILVKEYEKHGKGTLVAGGTKHFVDEGKVGDGFKRYDNWLNEVARTQTHWQEIYRECVIPSHCWIMHRQDFEAAGAFDPVVYPEDYDLCFRFYKSGLKVAGIDKILHYWRDRSDRISRTWEEYRDNRYFDLKLSYFYQLDRDTSRPLVLWGVGRNGKDMARLLKARKDPFHWVCDNPKKTGKDIYDIRIQHYNQIPFLEDPQIMIVVSSPAEQVKIRKQLLEWNLQPGSDFWFFI